MEGTLRRTRPLLALGLALFMALGAPFADFAMAATRSVSTTGADSGDCTASPCRTITYAVEASAAGDTINVAAGTYNIDGGEFFPINGSNLMIQGAGAGLSIIDYTGAIGPLVALGFGPPALSYYDEQVADTGLDGFTVMTNTTPAIGIGALNSLSPTISNNSISTTSGAAGIAIYAFNPYYSAATVVSPTITGNEISTTSGWGGVGFFKQSGYYSGPRKPSAEKSASGVFVPSTIAIAPAISGNTISGGMFGVGLYAMYSYYYGPVKPSSAAPGKSASCCGPMAALDFSPTISDNTLSSMSYGVFVYDYAYTGYYGASDTISPVIARNTIESPGKAGIEIVVFSRGSGIINATIEENMITNAPGGILIASIFGASASAAISNNTVTGGGSLGVLPATVAYYNFPGILVEGIANSDASFDIDHNTLTGFDTGILAVGTLGSSTITNNALVDNTGYGVVVYGGFFGPTKPASSERSASRPVPTGASSMMMSNNTITGSTVAALLYGSATYYGETPEFDLGGGSLGSTGRNTLSGSTSDLENHSTSTVSAMSDWFSDTPVIVESPGLVTYSALDNELSLNLTPAEGIKDGSAAFAISAASDATFFQTGIGSSAMPSNISVTFAGAEARFVSVSSDGKTITGLAPVSRADGPVDVVVTNPGGQTGSLEEAFTYLPSSANAPTAPVPYLPLNGARGIDPSSIFFTWLPSIDADGDIVAYDLYVCADSTFESCPAPVNSVRVALLEAGAMYAGMGSLGLVMMGIALAGGMSRRRKVALLLLIAALTAMAAMTLASCGSDLGDNKGDKVVYEVTDLEGNTTYYWKIVAYDGTGNLTESSVYSFTTQ